MIWIRVAVVVVAAAIVALAVMQKSPPAQEVLAAPTPAQPTRVPLPTLAPQMIISRTAQETPTPAPTPTRSAIPRVAVIDNGYAPAQLEIGSGTTVQWANLGGDGHDVTGRGPDGVWRSGPLAPGDRYQRTFYMSGTYDYVCTVHPEMRGQVVVQP